MVLQESVVVLDCWRVLVNAPAGVSKVSSVANLILSERALIKRLAICTNVEEGKTTQKDEKSRFVRPEEQIIHC
jgi:hypothetical protein